MSISSIGSTSSVVWSGATTSSAVSRFKLRETSKVKALIRQVFVRSGWVDAGQGREGVEDELLLTGWTKKRRVVVLRRRIKEEVAVQAQQHTEMPRSQQLLLIEEDAGIVQ